MGKTEVLFESAGDAGEAISGAAFILGTCAGLDQAAKMLRDRAGELFARGSQDAEAKICRALAEILEADQKKERKYYDETSRPRCDAGFKFLEAIDAGRDPLE